MTIVYRNIKKYTIAAVICIGIIMMAFLKFHGNIPEYVTHMGYADEEQFVYYLQNEDIIEQRFRSPHEFDFLSIHFSNHEQIISGKTFINVIDSEDGSVIKDYVIDNSNISYAEPVKVMLPNGGMSNHEYLVSIHFEGMGECGLGIFGHGIDDSNQPPSSIDSGYSVAIGTHTYTNLYKNIVAFVVVLLCLIVVWSTFCFTNSEWGDERRFLSIVIPMGIFFLSFMTYNAVHDGTVHMSVVYHYANEATFNESKAFPEFASLYADEANIVAETNNYSHVENPILSEMFYFTEGMRHTHLGMDRIEQDKFVVTTNSSIMEYLPAIVATVFSRGLFLSASWGLLLARIAMFSFYVLVCYWAIKIVPTHKILIAFVSLIPMNLYQATQVTYDAVVIPICILVSAIFIKAQICLLNKRDRVLFYITCFLIGLSKGGVYLLLPLLFLSMPKKVDGCDSNKKRIVSIGAICGVLGFIPCFIRVYAPYIAGVFTEIPGYSSTTTHTANIGTKIYTIVDDSGQQAYTFKSILEYPFGAAKAIIYSFIYKSEDMFGQAIGNRMAWTDATTNWIIITLLIVLLIASTVNLDGERQYSMNFGTRLYVWLLIVVEIIAISVIMLISDLTPIGSEEIKGVQGRYFIPWFVLALASFSTNQIKITKVGKIYLYYAEALMLVAYGLSFVCIFMGV